MFALAAAWPNEAFPDQPQLAQAAPVASEFRGSTRGRQGSVEHIWRLRADGTITGQSTERRGGGLGGYAIERSGTGRWQVRQGQLCIDWGDAFAPLSGCYAIERQRGTHVRLAGPVSFEGTLDPVLP